MISKFAVFGKDRLEAIERMSRALEEYEVGGIKTTLPFFREVMRDHEFIDGKLDTGFIDRFMARKQEAAPGEASRDMALIAAAMSHSTKRKRAGHTADGGRAQQSRWGSAARIAGMRGRF